MNGTYDSLLPRQLGQARLVNSAPMRKKKLHQIHKHTHGLFLWVVALVSLLGAGTAFASAPAVATLTSPANGAKRVASPCTFKWTGVAAAQAYYLWVGTSPGAKDVVQTNGGLPASSTSYTATSLPYGQTLYATIWTELAGSWWPSSSTFTTALQIATLTSPANGAKRVASPCTFNWTGVAAAQAYYLWVGTSPGAKDVVQTSGGLPAGSTSYTATSLPYGQTLYATIWTELAGAWWPSSSTFTTALQTAVLTSPANGATKVASPCTFNWTGVAAAQAYYLWVGTSPGAKDVVQTSGGLPAGSTSYTVNSLPYGQTLYATIWVELAGAWWPSSSTFTTAPQIAVLTSPESDATKVASPCTFNWTGVAAAQAYYLWVGTSPGAKDVVNNGSLPASRTFYTARDLPCGQTLYATIWTELAGIWWPSQSSFTTTPAAILTAPADGATGVASTCTFQWTGAPAAQSYYLWVGTSPGAKDLIQTRGGLPAGRTSYTVNGLPHEQTLYATLWTELAGHWYSSSSTFTTGPQIATLKTPADGATNVDPDCVLQWTSVPGAQGYYLCVGTSPGAKDIVNTGGLLNTFNSWPGIDLPLGQTLYATIWTELAGVWWPSSSSFTTMASPLSSATPNGASSMVFPVDGAVNIDGGQPFQWTYSGYTGIYWLMIGSTHGGCDISNSGPIHVPRQFVSDLPLGALLYGQLFVKAGDTWSLADDFTFSVGSITTRTNTRIQSAFWATDFVRHMADDKNTAFAGTLLADYSFPHSYYPHANCGVYAQTLMTILDEMALPLETRILRIVFDTNAVACDGHVLVEMFNPHQQSWMLLDPCFDLTAQRSSDGTWATAEDISTATRNQTWDQIDYVFLGEKGDTYARNYFIDYPLLYLNVYHDGTPIVPLQGLSILPYFSRLSLPFIGKGTFAIRSKAQYTVTYVDAANGNKLCSVDCDGVDSFSHVFIARSVAVPDGESSFELYTPDRHVF